MTFLIALIILAVCVVLLSIGMILKKGRKFPNTHVSGNKALRDKGIYCAKTQDKQAQLHKDLEERLKN